MEIKAGSFLSGAALDLKYYKEEEVETATYKLERVFSGSKLTLRLFVKDANAQETVELLPMGRVTKFFFVRLGMNITSGLTSEGKINVLFNNLTVNNQADSITFTPHNTNQCDEISRWENISAPQYYNAISSNLTPTVFDNPFTIALNNPGFIYSDPASYEIIMEFNIYDK